MAFWKRNLKFCNVIYNPNQLQLDSSTIPLLKLHYYTNKVSSE